MDNYIIHSGVGHEDDPPGRGSGRYAWGSGENPYQHQFNFLSEVKNLRNQGLTDKVIAEMLLGPKYYKKDGTPVMSNTTDLKAEIAIQTSAQRQTNILKVKKLYDECNGNVSEVARRMSDENKTWNESTIRSLLKPEVQARTTRYENTAKLLKDTIAKKGMIDVSSGTELDLGVSDNTKKVAIAMLVKEGYVKTYIKIPQMTTKNSTNMMVLAPPGTEYSEIYKNRFNVQPVADYTPDNGATWFVPKYPKSVDPKRVMVRYAEEGGKDKDGVIELRKGVEDISLDGSQYAQVRIMVGDTNYMKGMAMYGDDKDFPKGVDIIYNTNKSKGVPLIDSSSVYDPASDTWSGKEVTKRCKVDANGNIDKDNPFGALIKAGGQREYVDKNGKTQLSPINKLREEGDWDSWSRTLASQFLAKQPMKLINRQLDSSLKDRQNELKEIMALTNPVIKKKLLESYADGCDANATDLSAKGFKNQAYQVLLPVPSMKDTEIYAPNYQNGDRVALVRYPHGGTFEIPILTVNNNNAAAKKVMKNASDAVGINPVVAERLSGADFDGDTAICIPLDSNKINVTSTKPLKGLVDFDPKALYKLPDSAPQMKNDTKQRLMGEVTNLITDMSIAEGASLKDIEKAVRHSMVVIDAEKHHLDYKQSAKDNDIAALKKRYQGRINETSGRLNTGASTILSRSTSEIYVDQRKEVTDVRKMTPEQLKDWNEGKKVYVPTEKTKYQIISDPAKMTPEELKVHNAGKKVYRQTSERVQEKISQMEAVDDAMKLVHDPHNPKEVAYANYANGLKDLARQARREARGIKAYPISKEARITYAKEVASLTANLKVAKSNQPKERIAQAMANNIVREKLASNPGMDYEHQKREQARALTYARAQVGAKKQQVPISEREWEAIQSRAVSYHLLEQIINNADEDLVKKLATPRKDSSSGLTDAQISRIKAMIASGRYTNADIAAKFGVSASYVSQLGRS